MNANDFLKGTDRNFGAKVKAGYTSDNLEWQKSAYAFGRSNQWDVVFGVSRRDSGASTNSLTGKRSKADIDAYSTAAFGKASFMPNDANVLSLSYNFDRANSKAIRSIAMNSNASPANGSSNEATSGISPQPFNTPTPNSTTSILILGAASIPKISSTP